DGTREPAPHTADALRPLVSLPDLAHLDRGLDRFRNLRGELERALRIRNLHNPEPRQRLRRPRERPLVSSAVPVDEGRDRPELEHLRVHEFTALREGIIEPCE